MPSERSRSKHGDDDDDNGNDYLDLERLARYSSLSVRTLRRHLTDPVHPLPHHHVRPPGKRKGRVLVSKRAFDRWMEYYAVEQPDAAPADDFSWIKTKH